jgi:lysophospholipase L1-like esterase
LLHQKAVRDYLRLNRPYGRTVLFVVAALLLGPLLTVVLLNQAVGLYLSWSPETPVLVLPANTRVEYRTSEFQYTAETNAVGFRDRAIDIARKAGLRVLAIGDSFTYGWGVAIEQSWPKVLEARLRSSGCDAEVLNLGCPGTSVDAYAAITERAIPLLKPDLVLIAVLQGDDVKQLDLGPTIQKVVGCGESRNTFRWDAESFLPNLFKLRERIRVRKPSVISAVDMRAEWRRLANEIRDHLNSEEMQRFEGLDAEVKAMVMEGDLNPWEVYNAVKTPDYMAFTLNPERAEVRRATDLMATYLTQIKRVAERENSEVRVLSVPAGWYVSARALKYKRQIGFCLDDSALHSTRPDDVISSACQAAGVDFHSVTGDFRQAAVERDLYYPFDGHFNSAGCALFAERIAKMLLRRKKMNIPPP